MKNKFWMIVALGTGIAAFSAPLLAHHGQAAYDTDKRITIKGTVTAWLWSNPHCLIQVDAPDDSGQVAHWVAETENPSSMIRSGWTKDSIKVGDQITLILVPPKAGGPAGRIVEIIFPDGHKLLGKGNPVEPPKQDQSAKT